MKMISEKEWLDFVESCEAKGKNNKEKLKEAIVEAIKNRIPGEKFGIFFSGGVDSSTIALVAKRFSKNFTCYSVGFQDKETAEPADLVYARKVAKALNVNYVEKVFNLAEAEKIIKKVVEILPKPKEIDADYIVKVGVGCVLVAVSTIAKEKVFFSGLGSEEIFAGYQRHEKASDVNAECWSGLKKMYKRDLIRDLTIAEKLNFGIETPFLDRDVIIEAMKFPADRKISKEHKKIILREIAEELGLPKEFAWRKKLGAQYGSRFDKAIDKLARKNGFKYKKEYLHSLL